MPIIGVGRSTSIDYWIAASRTLGLICKEGIDLACRPVVGDDVEPLVVHVKDQVLTLLFKGCEAKMLSDGRRDAYHDGKADQANVSTRGHGQLPQHGWRDGGERTLPFFVLGDEERKMRWWYGVKH